MGYIRGFDTAFVRPKPNVRTPTVSGGLITVIATTATIVLMTLQLFGNSVERHDGLTMSASQQVPLMPLTNDGSRTKMATNTMGGRLPLDFQVTFPYLTCDQLDASLDGASFKSGELAKSQGGSTVSVSFRTASPSEIKLATGGYSRTSSKGCTASGRLRPFIVAGIFAVGFHRQSWADATTSLSMGMWGNSNEPDIGSKYNCTHYIHHVQFGTYHDDQTFAHHEKNPLRNVLHGVNNDFHAIGIAYTQVKLVPTKTASGAASIFGSNQKMSHQVSVVDVTIQPQSMAGSTSYPGLVVSYDFTPLTIVVKDIDEDQGNILLVLSSLVGILGGVFVTVQLLTGCLVHSAQEIAKKID